MRVRRHILILAVLALLGCGTTTAPEAPSPAAKPKLPDLPNPIAEDVKFPRPNRQSIEVVPEKLLGYAFLGGGNLAAYSTGKKQYKLFTIRCRSAQQAGAYIFDIKSQLKDPRFVASYGGYFSEMPEGPLFVFAKGSYIGGIAGLSETEAIETGKAFAARL
jgi:hypothetical protein